MSPKTFQYMVTALAILGFCSFLWAWSEWKRRQFKKFVDGKVRGAFMMISTGKYQTEMLKVQSEGPTAHVRFPDTGKDGDPIYYLGDVAKTGFDSVYPYGGFMERLGSPVKTIIFREGDARPLLEAIKPQNKDGWDSSLLNGILVDEKTSKVVAQQVSDVSKEQDEEKKAGLVPLYIYIGFGVLAALMGVLLYLQIKESNVISSLPKILDAVQKYMGLK